MVESFVGIIKLFFSKKCCGVSFFEAFSDVGICIVGTFVMRKDL
jgi:hypothetical protein